MKLPITLHQLHIEDINNVEHPSIFILDDEYNILIVRLPHYNKEFGVTSYPFILSNNRTYYFDRAKDDFTDLGEGFGGLYKFIDRKVDYVVKMLLRFHEDIIVSEEGLYNNQTTDFLKDWYEEKMNLIRVHRILLKGSSVLNEFLEFYQEGEEFLHNEFEDIIEHIERSERSAQSGLLKLDQLYSFYSVRTSEKMNQSVYYLTIISAIFLPLNLAVGLFGMNTGGLPLAENTNGTFIAIGLMLGTTAILSTIAAIYLKKRASK